MPDFPDRFGSLADARAFCGWFFEHYNHEHRHSGIGMHTPADVHHGHAHAVREQRATVLTLECSRKSGGVVYAASSWMCLNPSSYSCGVK